jgi:Zn-dependent peptidase ImmA (M78 family)
VPIETVIRKFDDDIVLVVHDEIECGRLRDGSPAILGLSRWSRDGRRRELVINEDIYEAENAPTRRRANFTMAHELGHCIEHLPLVQNRQSEAALLRTTTYVSLAPQLLSQPWFKRKSARRKLSTPEQWREWQANQFAAELLMPAESVRSAFEQCYGCPLAPAKENTTVEELSDQTARTIFEDEFGTSTSLVDRFDVNPQAMAYRLIALGLVSG